MRNVQLRWIYLLVLSIIWGSSFILIKKSLIGLTPIQVGALRILITAIVLLSVGFKELFTIQKKHWYYIFLTAVLGTFFPAFLFAYAINGIDSSIASILNSLTPLNTLLIGALLFGFRFIPRQLTGILIGLIGTAILIFKGAELNPHQNYWYAFFVIASSIGYAFNVNILKKYLSDLSALSVTTGNFVILIIPASMVLWYSGFFQTFELTEATRPSLIYITLLAVFGTAFAKTLFNRLVQMSSPVFSTSVTYLIPIVAVSWGLLDGEHLKVIQLIGGALILLGVYMTNRK
ncbi:MAG TPA: DMT family transporter [Flavobacteriia bacterium]|nr:DMT family transporter [Flavobacteriia bacterium]